MDQQYAFSLFLEEAGEALQSIGKAGRFGLDTPGVKDPYTGDVDMSITPRTSLQKELGDVLAAIDFIGLCGIVDRDMVKRRHVEKLSKLIDPSSLDNLGRKLAPTPKYVDELEKRIAALEAEKAERERQEPVAWQDIHDHMDLYWRKPPEAGPDVRPLYASPLAIREPSDEECAAIYRNYVCPPVPCEEVSSDVELGRLMVRAVREVLK